MELTEVNEDLFINLELVTFVEFLRIGIRINFADGKSMMIKKSDYKKIFKNRRK